MTGRDRTLQRIKTAACAQLLRALQRGQATADQQLVPLGAILVQEQDGLSRRTHARFRPGRLDLHERHQAVDLGLTRHQLGQDTAQTERVFTKCRAHPIIPGGSRVAFVKDEVDDFQH